MAFSNSSSAGAPMCDINTTPLVDVMLVLLIIFMITAPVMAHKTQAQVPMRGPIQTVPPEPPTIYTIDVQPTASKIANVGMEGVNIGLESLLVKLKLEAQKTPQPEINIRTAPTASYEHMAQVMALIKRAGIKKVRFDELNPPGLVPEVAPPPM